MTPEPWWVREDPFDPSLSTIYVVLQAILISAFGFLVYLLYFAVRWSVVG